MNIFAIATAALVALAAFLPSAGAGGGIAVSASLKDGSSVKGALLTESVVGSTLFAEKIALDPPLVKDIRFKGANGEAKVSLNNGDMFAMTVHTAEFHVKTLLGDLKLPCSAIRAVSFAKARNETSGETEPGLVFHCTFDDEASVSTPAAGPEGTVCSREFVNGKVNGAVRVPAGSSAGVFRLPPETFGKEGCIEFWAKIEPMREFYRDCDPRMIVIDSPAGWFTVEYSSNNGLGKGGFCVRCFGLEYVKGGSFGRNYRYADVIADVSAWHHYAFSWTQKSLDVYIDGKMLNGIFKTEGDRIDEEKLRVSPAVMGLPNTSAGNRNTEPNAPFSIDELKIWDHAKQEFGL